MIDARLIAAELCRPWIHRAGAIDPDLQKRNQDNANRILHRVSNCFMNAALRSKDRKERYCLRV